VGLDQKSIEGLSGFITVDTLTRINGDLENKIHRVIDGVEKKVQDINQELKSMDVKVDGLKDIVIPMVVNFEHLVKNTEKTNVILEEWVKEQRLTNGLTGEKFQNQDKEFIRINGKLENNDEKKKLNIGVIVAVITVAPALMGVIYTILSSMDLFNK